jgi:hypothetical protein
LVRSEIVLLSFLLPYPLVLTLMVIFPTPPAGICLEYEAAVHPQPFSTL